MSGIHVFGQNEFGTACVRCGYFNHTQEAGKDCSGTFDEKLLHDIEHQLKSLTLKRDMVLGARESALAVTQHINQKPE